MIKRSSCSLILLVFVLFGCSTKRIVENDQSLSEMGETNWKNYVDKKYIVYPGKMTLISFPYLQNFAGAKLFCGDQEVSYFLKQGMIKAFISKSYFDEVKDLECFIQEKEKDHPRQLVARIKMHSYKYPSSRLKVDKKRVFLSKRNKLRVKRERKILRKVYASTSPNILFKESFVRPLTSLITSEYGTRRLFNNAKKSYHFGVDFRAGVGASIRTSNSGKVVFVGKLFYTGNTVIVDHGQGLLTTYCHLSKIVVKNGDFVPKLGLVGLAGMTGRVTGPHLHWGVKHQGEWIDGLSLADIKLEDDENYTMEDPIN